MNTMTFLINDSTADCHAPVVQVSIGENADGTLTFTLTQRPGYVGDLRGLFFDVSDESLIGSLTATATRDLTELRQGNDTVRDLGNGANMNGLLGRDAGYDVGIEIGDSGLKTNDDIRAFTFTLGSSSRALTLADFSAVDFGARVTSVGLDANLDGVFETARSGSSKTGEMTFAVISPKSDAVSAVENTTVTGNVLANDGGMPSDALTRDHQCAGQHGGTPSDVLTVTGWSGGSLGTPQAIADLRNATIMLNTDGSYTVDASAADALAAGESVSHTFTYVVLQTNVDGTSTHTVSLTVTITGTNDAPVITLATTDALGAVTEDATTPTLSDIGLIAFNDLDLTDVHITRVAADPSNTLGGTLAMGAVSEDASTEPGSVGWTYEVANSAVQYLAKDQMATEKFTVTIDDGNGGTVDQEVEVTVKGTNDDPTITVGLTDALGAVTEDASMPTLTDAGLIAFNDADLIDVHATSVAPDAGNTLGGTLTMCAVSESPSTEPGTVGWTYEVANSAVQYLAVDETATEKFMVTIDDGQGGTVEQLVTAMVTGTNDLPIAADDTIAAVMVLVERMHNFEGAGDPSDVDGSMFAGFGTYSFYGMGGSWMAYVYTGNDFFEDGADGTLQRLDGQDFSLLSLDVAAFFTAHPVTIAGYDDGVQVASMTLDLGTAGPSGGTSGYTSLAFDASWASIDQVRFYADNVGDYIFLDNVHLATGTAGNEDTTLDIDVLANDTDPDASDVLAVSDFSAASAMGAVVSLNADGTLHYDPTAAAAVQALAAGETATDRFTYAAGDGHGGSDDATVNIQLIGVNDAPVAADDAGGIDEDSSLAIDVLANDTDPDASDVLAVSAFDASSAMGAAISLNANGTLEYDPTSAAAVQALAVGEIATDAFAYSISDGHGGSDEATVSIELTGVNDTPVAIDDANFFEKTHGFEGAVNPGDVDGSMFAGFSTYSFYGTGGSWMAYTPTWNGFFEDDGADGALQRLDGQDFALLSLDAAAYFTPHPVTIAGYDDGVQVASMTLDLDIAGPTGGASGYTPISFDALWASIDQVRFYADDVGDYIFLDNVHVTTGTAGNEDTPLDIDVLANDTDPDASDMLAVSEFSAASAMGAVVSLNADGTLRYDPTGVAALQALAAGQTATDSFTYTASDGHGGSDSATVNLKVIGVNDAPVAADDAFQVDEDGVLTVAASGVLGNDSDVDSIALSAAVVEGPSNGTLVLNGDGSFSYAPNADFNGSDSFSYVAGDGDRESEIATVVLSILAVDDAPVAVGDAYQLGAGGVLSVDGLDGVLANDSDVDSPALSAVLVEGPAHGTLAFNEDGSFSYAPDANFDGGDSFTYRASDGTLESNLATVALTVAAVNHAPVAANNSYSMNEDSTLTVAASAGVLANDTDADGDALSSVRVGGPAHGVLTLNADGSFSYTPTANYFGTDSFTYKANDGLADSKVATVSITIANMPEPGGNGKVVDDVSPGTVLKYYMKVDGVTDDWVQLDSFSLGLARTGSAVEGKAGAGNLTAEDVFVTLGSSHAGTVLIEAAGKGTLLKSVEIEAYALGSEGFKDMVDDFRFDNVLVSSLQTSAGASGTVNEVGFDYAKFGHTHVEYDDTGKKTGETETGWDFKTGKLVGGPGGSEDALKAKLEGADHDLEYYVRFEGVNASNEWLQLDSFSMGLTGTSSSTDGKVIINQPTASDVLLTLGSSEQLVKLTEMLDKGTILKFAEIEAYRAGGESKMLVDEYHFDNVLLRDLDSVNATDNALSFDFTKFSHGHVSYKADGTQAGTVSEGYDFTLNKAFDGPTPDADIGFFL